MIAGPPEDLGAGATDRDIGAKPVLCRGQGGQCPLGIAAILIDADGLGDVAAGGQQTIAPPQRDVGSRTVFPLRRFSIEILGSRLPQPAMIDQHPDVGPVRTVRRKDPLTGLGIFAIKPFQ